jgi:serine/threonine-protein kinase
VDETALASAPDGHLLGKTIGRKFVPMSLLGEGGMGYIYRATQRPVGRPVALKVLKDNYMGDSVIRDRFLREAEAIARMSHRNIVMLFDSGLDEGTGVLYMAMEYLNGRALSDELRQPLSLDRIVKISTGVAAALAEAHKHGIIHRDLKPENVFMVRDETGQEVPKVLDFGFARLQGATKKLTQAGIAFGTPHYMAPEQAMGLEGITAGADVYALGVMMYEMLSGDVPYDGTNAMEIMNKQVNAPVPPLTPRPGLGAPPRLVRLATACMQKEPEDRPSDGSAVLEELQVVAGELDAVNNASLPSLPNAPAAVAQGQAIKPAHLVLLVGGAVAFLLIGVIIALLFLSK